MYMYMVHVQFFNTRGSTIREQIQTVVYPSTYMYTSTAVITPSYTITSHSYTSHLPLTYHSLKNTNTLPYITPSSPRKHIPPLVRSLFWISLTSLTSTAIPVTMMVSLAPVVRAAVPVVSKWALCRLLSCLFTQYR